MLANEDAKKKILVEIIRQDGRAMSGNLILPMASDIVRYMNNATKYIEFEGLDGTSALIAKSSIVDLSSKSIPKAPVLETADMKPGSDPYAVLGITNRANSSEARKAFVKQTKRYHPDQYSSIDLPDEVVRYLNAMFNRLTTAYGVVRMQSEKEKA